MPVHPYFIKFNSIGSPGEGYISTTQFSDSLPFAIKRVFWTYDTPCSIVRGRHAHITAAQVIVALNGNIRLEVDNGKGSKNVFELSNPKQGLYLPPMHWTNIHFSDKAILLCMASTEFAEEDYIRNYDTFIARAQHTQV